MAASIQATTTTALHRQVPTPMALTSRISAMAESLPISGAMRACAFVRLERSRKSNLGFGHELPSQFLTSSGLHLVQNTFRGHPFAWPIFTEVRKGPIF